MSSQFISEAALKEMFFKYYNYGKRAKRYQFECPIRTGNADLITIEVFQNQWQINAFEFKLDDIKKALLQAKENLKWVNKSWIVMPSEKSKILMDRYAPLPEYKDIGFIVVEPGGRYSIIRQARFHKDVMLSQEIFNVAMNTYADDK